MELSKDYTVDFITKEKMEKGIAEIKERMSLYNSQYIERLNPEKKERIVWFYGQLKNIAFTNAGRVTLDIDEDRKEAELKYMGLRLFKTLEENDETGIIMAMLFYLYDLVTIEHEKGYFTVTVYEKLYDKIRNENKAV